MVVQVDENITVVTTSLNELVFAFIQEKGIAKYQGRKT